MTPAELRPDRFASYPPEARKLAVEHLSLLQKLPLSFLPLLLREVVAYDWKFPAERLEIDHQFDYLEALSSEQLRQRMERFTKLHLSSRLETVDWVNEPGPFSEQLSAHLWATHQIDEFRAAAVDYMGQVNAAAKPQALPVPRLAIAVIGKGVAENNYRLFRKLRRYGVYFNRVDPANGRQKLLDAVATRAKAHPVPFGHWYIDGGTGEAFEDSAIACVYYGALQPVRERLLGQIEKEMQGGAGSEALRSMLAQMRPEQLGLSGTGPSGVLNHFQISLLTEGSGTQLFSTTFVQWGAREALRRAQPLTILTRYAPRQRDRGMDEVFSPKPHHPELDPRGSLIDADMGAYYTWINQQRLSGAENASFLVWFEGHTEAVAIAPSLTRGKESNDAVDLTELIRRIS
jgi:hypothetical protein